MANNRSSNEVTYNVLRHIGVLAEYQTGWCKELNIVAWNGGTPKYDIRDWDPDHEHMTKGITMYEEEAKALLKILEERFKGGSNKPGGQVVVQESSPEKAEETGSIMMEETEAAEEPAPEEETEEPEAEEEEETA